MTVIAVLSGVTLRAAQRQSCAKRGAVWRSVRMSALEERRDVTARRFESVPSLRRALVSSGGEAGLVDSAKRVKVELVL